METLRDYYEADYNYALSAHRTRTFTIAGATDLVVHERLHLDFRSNAKFVSYFIPETPHAVELCREIMAHPEWGLSVADSVLVHMGDQGEELTPKDALVFSHQFVFYIDQPLDPATVAVVRQAAVSMGFVVLVRGHEYAE